MSEPTFGAKPKRLSRNKKIGLFAIGGIGGLALIVWYRRRQQNANANSAGTDTSTGGIDPNAIDPNTGIPYSQEGYGATGGYPGLQPGPGIPGVYSPTNGTWAIEAETYLVSLGYNPVTVSTALGLYLAGKPLTQDEYDIVTSAIGFEGNPPDGAPSPILQSGGGGNPGPTITVPNIVGMRDVTARALILSKGLRYTADRSGNALKGASWIVQSQDPAGGRKVKIGTRVTAQLTAHKSVDRKIGPARQGR